MVSSRLNISSEDRDLFAKIQTGDRNAILKGLIHPGAIYRVNAAMNAVRYNIKDVPVKIYLGRMKKDDIFINGYRVSDFAHAALDLLGLESYFGNELRVRRLITSKFDFLNEK